MSQDRSDRAAADTGRPQGRPLMSRGQRGGWGPRSSRGGRRPQCMSSVMCLQFWFKRHFCRHTSPGKLPCLWFVTSAS